MQRIANPCTSVQFQLAPPNSQDTSDLPNKRRRIFEQSNALRSSLRDLSSASNSSVRASTFARRLAGSLFSLSFRVFPIVISFISLPSSRPHNGRAGQDLYPATTWSNNNKAWPRERRA